MQVRGKRKSTSAKGSVAVQASVDSAEKSSKRRKTSKSQVASKDSKGKAKSSHKATQKSDSGDEMDETEKKERKGKKDKGEAKPKGKEKDKEKDTDSDADSHRGRANSVSRTRSKDKDSQTSTKPTKSSSKASKSKSKGWACDYCTFVNLKNENRCEICNIKRDQGEKERKSSGKKSTKAKTSTKTSTNPKSNSKRKRNEKEASDSETEQEDKEYKEEKERKQSKKEKKKDSSKKGKSKGKSRGKHRDGDTETDSDTAADTEKKSGSDRDRGDGKLDENQSIAINRAPVLTLWVAVVGERQGFSWDTSLTLGKAIAGMFAYAKGRSIGLMGDPSGDRPTASKTRKITVMGRKIIVKDTEEGTVAVAAGKPLKPAPVQTYLQRAFGSQLSTFRRAMQQLAAQFDGDALNDEGYRLYETFRPTVAGGGAGWGQKATMSVRQILQAAS